MITPLYTNPKPPAPRTFCGSKLEVPYFSSAYLNSRSLLDDLLLDSSEEGFSPSDREADEDLVSSTLLLLLLLLVLAAVAALEVLVPGSASTLGRTFDGPCGADADVVVLMDSETSPARRAVIATAGDRRRCWWWSRRRDLVSTSLRKISVWSRAFLLVPPNSSFRPKQDIDEPSLLEPRRLPIDPPSRALQQLLHDIQRSVRRTFSAPESQQLLLLLVAR